MVERRWNTSPAAGRRDAMNLVEAFRACARLRTEPDPGSDSDRYRQAAEENRRRNAAAQTLFAELERQAVRRLVASDTAKQRTCKEEAPTQALDNLCLDEPRGIRSDDPDTEGAVRAYLGTTLRFAFINCVRLRGGHEGPLPEGDDGAHRDASDWNKPTDKPDNPPESIECLEGGYRTLDVRAIPMLTERDQQFVAQCRERRAAEDGLVGRNCGHADRRETLRLVWGRHIESVAAQDETVAIRTDLSAAKWREQFEVVRICDELPAPTSDLVRLVMDRLAQAQHRSLVRARDALGGLGLPDDERFCAELALWDTIPGHRATVFHPVKPRRRRPSVAGQ